MGRRPEGAAARTERLEVRMTEAGMAKVDEMRGSLSRSGWLRLLIAQEAKRRG